MKSLVSILICGLFNAATCPFEKPDREDKQCYYKQFALVPEEQNVFVDDENSEVPDEVE